MPTLIHNALIINEGEKFHGYILIEEKLISKVGRGDVPAELLSVENVTDASGKWLIPGVIDCHVHFREPGVTHKADLSTESHAAVAGGVTSFLEMPNTQPQTTTLQLLAKKEKIASEKSLANYAFFLGATNDNIEEIKNANPKKVCGVKVFFGASTGNMLVDKMQSLESIFKNSPIPVAAHAENEQMIKAKSAEMLEKYGEDVPVEMHPDIRSNEACYTSAKLAVDLARKYGTRLHLTHVTTKEEAALLRDLKKEGVKNITSETCPHYLVFNSNDYTILGTKLKVNPAVKSPEDQSALLAALLDGSIDIIATDHAPHLLSEKDNTYFKAPSGMPSVQFSLQLMLEFVKSGKMTPEFLVEKMCHTPAECYSIEKRGFLREGYYADIVLIDPEKPYPVEENKIYSKCAWSPFEGKTFSTSIEKTFVNGSMIFDNGIFNENIKGQALVFNR